VRNVIFIHQMTSQLYVGMDVYSEIMKRHFQPIVNGALLKGMSVYSEINREVILLYRYYFSAVFGVD